MVVLGNLQLAPRDLRERGYAGYVEWAAMPALAVGVSTLGFYTDDHRPASEAPQA